MTNAAGSLTNAEGYVTQQWFDTNLFELTTNWFECVDIGLTNGNNTITLRSTDFRQCGHECLHLRAGSCWRHDGARPHGVSAARRLEG